MTVDIATARHVHSHAGASWYFCSRHCLEKFAAEPGRYTVPSKSAHDAAPGALYTCPMHPEIREHGPGHCPKCGMALEPVTASADPTPNPELADMTRRFWAGLALTIPVFALAMAEHLPVVRSIMPSAAVSGTIQLLFSTPVVLWSAWPFFVRGWSSLVSRSL